MDIVYLNLIDQKEPKLDFVTEESKSLKMNKKIDYCKKIIEPTEEEYQNHKIFIKKSLKRNA